MDGLRPVNALRAVDGLRPVNALRAVDDLRSVDALRAVVGLRPMGMDEVNRKSNQLHEPSLQPIWQADGW